MEKYIFTDLAKEMESDPKSEIFWKEERYGEGIRLHRMMNKKSGAPLGCVSLDFAPVWLLENEVYKELCRVLATELVRMMNLVVNIPKGISSVLVVGLGNEAFLADSVGPRAARSVHVQYDLCEASKPHVFSIVPDVSSNTGIESVTHVAGVVSRVHPELVIAIDSLRAKDGGRIGSTVQMTSFGIRPGSGVGGHSSALDVERVGVPVISLGLPTVVQASALLADPMKGTDCKAENGKTDRSFWHHDYLVMPREIDLVVRHGAMLLADAINLAMSIYCTSVI